MRYLSIIVFIIAAGLNAHAQAANSMYCSGTGLTPLWNIHDGPALLPVNCYKTDLASTPATGSVVTVTTAGQLTTALAAAACGQQITLTAGNTFSGNFVVPHLVCPQSNYLWIQSSAVSSLPAEGARYTTTANSLTLYAPQFGPCYAGVTSLVGRPALNCPLAPGTYTAKLSTPNTSPVLSIAAGTTGVRFIGLEITRATGTGNIFNLTNIGNRGGTNYIIFDRCWAHGVENDDETDEFIDFSSMSYVAVIDSYLNDFYCISVSGSCSDATAIAGGLNTIDSIQETGQKIVNNFIESSGENIEYGGGASNTNPADIEVRLNLFFKPQTWNPSSLSYDGGSGGNPYIVKNLFELKNAVRLLLEGNELVNNWGGFSQNGFGILLTPKSQAIGGGGSACLNCLVTDVTVRYNIMNTVCNVAEFSAIRDDNGGMSSGGRYWSIHDLVTDNVFYSTSNGCSGIEQTDILEDLAGITSANIEHDITINHTTTVTASGAVIQSALGLSGLQIASGLNQYNISYINNVVYPGSQGTVNSIGGGLTANCAYSVSAGTTMINDCWSPNVFGGNCFVNNATSGTSWPGSNVTSVATFTAAFVSYNSGNAGNYTLSSNACKGAGLDGFDPGANITRTADVIAGTMGVFAVPAGIARAIIQ